MICLYIYKTSGVSVRVHCLVRWCLDCQAQVYIFYFFHAIFTEGPGLGNSSLDPALRGSGLETALCYFSPIPDFCMALAA